jgi:hypothetical protein
MRPSLLPAHPSSFFPTRSCWPRGQVQCHPMGFRRLKIQVERRHIGPQPHRTMWPLSSALASLIMSHLCRPQKKRFELAEPHSFPRFSVLWWPDVPFSSHHPRSLSNESPLSARLRKCRLRSTAGVISPCSSKLSLETLFSILTLPPNDCANWGVPLSKVHFLHGNRTNAPSVKTKKDNTHNHHEWIPEPGFLVYFICWHSE